MIADFANEEFPCIPQPEATFKLSNIKPNDFEGHFKAYRNIIIIRQKKIKNTNIRYKKNVWATHQQLIEIDIPNIASFSTAFEEHRTRIFNFLYEGDIKTMQLANQKGADQKLSHYIHKKYGINMALPKGFKLMKDTADFCWFTFDRLATSTHIVIQSFNIKNLSSINNEYLVYLRDSIGKAFIPGPSELSYMQTEKRLPVMAKNKQINNMNITEIRGLWKVEGFFMGGPFVNYFIRDKAHDRLLMIDGFIYAPQKQNKAHYVRQMESILRSVKI
ncbi:hypothetical protein JCM21142_117 [Saccharicrinis fermentans DSM 9555 = JCM 21142]|uniref:DUF4837 domain-containing protein n=2 Tax=Saccharicrinis fermentans TaxID=982 RepID=W7YFY6_9BACT|nr:hypothetical protein JCM21142_117 [Saccharicrinis fermentans DSM 9555 = JCM 21142]